MNDLQQEKLIGKVKSVRSTNWKNVLRESEGNIDGGELNHYGNHLKKYNENGNLTVNIDYHNSYGTPSSTKKFKYDTEGKLIEIDLDILLYKESYKYDYQGRVVEINRCSYQGQLLRVTKYSYNPNGTVNAIHDHNIYESRLKEAFYKYDKCGNAIELKSYINKILEYKALNLYDASNNNIKSIVFQIDEAHKNSFGIFSFPFIYENVPSFECNYKYDERGNIIESFTKRKFWTVFDYFIPFNLSRLFYKYFSKENFEYDDKDNLIREIWANKYKYGSRDTFTNEYEYDSEGNWVKKVRFGESTTMKRSGSLFERTIKYYK